MVSYHALEHAHLRLCEVYKLQQSGAASCPPFADMNLIAVGECNAVQGPARTPTGKGQGRQGRQRTNARPPSPFAAGDFYQLPPVKARFVFERIYGASAPLHHLWRGSDHYPGRAFVGYNLMQNQRQRGDTAWATALNALRDDRDPAAVQSAIQLLRTRVLRPGGPVPPAEFADATHIFPLTSQVDEHNAGRLRNLVGGGAPSATIVSLHTHIRGDGTVTSSVPREWLPDPKNRDEAGGLPEVLRLAIGARVMLRRNLDTEDGLVNGAVGSISKFKYADGTFVEAGSAAPLAEPRPAARPAGRCCNLGVI